jgi:hypothetical protein
MYEYLSLGHMEAVPPEGILNKSYYLSHHAIIKSSRITTKVRVASDSSASSNNGVSLNNILERGPTVQPGLVSILLRFRVYNFVLTDDIEKMYRQVRISPSDYDLKSIVFRNNQEDPVIDYRLLTVTYSTKPASYLATKCLSQLSNETNNPSVKRAISEDFYVDNFTTGASNESKCFSMYTELCKVLNSSGMTVMTALHGTRT